MADLIVVEDDGAVRELVTHVLERAGHAVRAAPDAATLHRLLSVRPPDLVVLDLTLPDGDGLSLARDLRGRGGDLGIVVLSALGEAMDRVAGLEVGADDYLAKPFECDELVARVEVVLRRRRPGGPPRPRLGPWRIESDTARAVHDDGRTFRLAGSELALTLAFALRPGRVLGREELLDLAPGREDMPFDRSIDHRVVRLRRKLGDDPRHPTLIRSVRGRGYVYRP